MASPARFRGQPPPKKVSVSDKMGGFDIQNADNTEKV